ncbi:MAG TPA: hypothetical protein VGU68_03770 [Ktedonobacteraceae bacterium]|nr:hypothetical protein [Ktedonobacteraceae bacterium]
MTKFEHLTKTRPSSWTWRILGGILLLMLLAGCASNGSSGTSVDSAGTATTSSSSQASKATSTTTNTASVATSAATSAPASTSDLANKPLHLPSVAAGAACPVSQIRSGVVPGRQYALGNGPVYLVVTNPTPTIQYTVAPFIGDTSSELGGSRSIWAINPNYQGTVLIRGQQLGGNNPLRFNGGLDQVNSNSQGTEPILNDLRLNGQQGQNSSWSSFVTFTRMQAPGCYGVQVDGQNFSEVIVFQASATN